MSTPQNVHRRIIHPIAVAAVALSVALLLPAAANAQFFLPDNGSGTADMPPSPHPYFSETKMLIEDGFPAGTFIEMDGTLDDYFNIVRNPGGNLGGTTQTWDGVLTLELDGVGTLAGYSRTLFIPVAADVHDAPRVAFAPVQTFATEMFTLQGQIFGDPDFDTLSIVAGGGFGLPSPGSTTLTQSGPQWQVDSFFDIEYRIDFVGAPGSVLEGMSGSTTRTVRLSLPEPGSLTVLLLGSAIAFGMRRRRVEPVM